MNHIYRIIFNQKQGVFQAVCEHAKNGHGEKSATTTSNAISSKIFNWKRTALSQFLRGIFGVSAMAAVLFGGTAHAARHLTSDTTIDGILYVSVIEADDIYLDGIGTYTVTVTGGGLIQTTAGGTGAALVIGRGSTDTNATLNVDAGGQVDVYDKLLVGQSGATGILNINSGGIVTARNGGNIGAVGGASATTNIYSGGVLDSAGYMYVGGDSTGELNVFNGGSFTSSGSNSIVGIGINSGGHGTVNVEGSMTLGGSTALIVGDNSTGIMNVNNGGTVSVASYAWIGYRTGEGFLTVSGAGSEFQTTGTGSFRIGDGAGSGTVIVEDGGYIKISGGNVQIGKGQSGSGGSGALTITGSGSLFESTATGILEIGTGASSAGSVTVADGGQLKTNTSQINVGTGSGGSGVLNIGAARGAAAVTAGSIVNGNTINLGTYGSLVFNHTNSGYVFASPITGSGAVYQENAGSTTILTGNNDSFGGSIAVNGGTLQIGNAGASGSIGSSDVAVASGATLAANRTGTMTISGIISGAGSVEQNGAGTTILTGANTYSGGTLVTAGTLQGNTTSLQGDIVNNATLIFDQATDGTYSGTLSGTGTLTKAGSDALTLAANAATGQVNLNTGTLNIDAGRTLTVANGMNMASGTTLGVDIASTPAVVADTIMLTGSNIININGYSARTDSGVYTLATTTSGVSGSFETTVAGAPLHTYVDLDTYLIGSAWIDATGKNILARVELVWNNNDPSSAHGTFNIPTGESFDVGIALADNTLTSALGFGWNGQDLTKTGAGTLILDGVNTYTGHTEVQDGTLLVGTTAANSSAQIAGHVDVQSGATLAGHGRILGTATINNGGTLSPGNSVGTLTVADAVFNSGSTYQIDVNPDGTADKLVANSALGGTGTVTIDSGAKLGILAGAGTWNTSTRYLIIDTDGGVTGQFGTVTSNLAFLTETVNYDISNQVWLTMSRNDVGFDELPGGTYNENNTGKGIESLGSGNAIYDTVVSMDSLSALNAFANLSGEIHGSAKSAVLTNRYARDAINEHLYRSPVPDADLPEAKRALWVSTWGYDGHLKNDGNAAKLETQGWGVLVGADIYDNGTTAAGLAMGYEQTDIKARSTRNSAADINMVHLLAYGRTSAGPIDIRAAAGYSWLDIDTTRYVNVGSISSKNQASYSGGRVQAYVEGSHTFELTEQASVTPFLNVAYQRITAESFTEEGSQAMLQGHRSSDHLVTTTAGVRGQWQLNDKASIDGHLGWQHNIGDVAPHARLNFMGGTTYNVDGTRVDRDSAIVGLGGTYQIRPDMRLSAGYEGQFGNQSREHALKVQFRYSF